MRKTKHKRGKAHVPSVVKYHQNSSQTYFQNARLVRRDCSWSWCSGATTALDCSSSSFSNDDDSAPFWYETSDTLAAVVGRNTSFLMFGAMMVFQCCSAVACVGNSWKVFCSAAVPASLRATLSRPCLLSFDSFCFLRYAL
jgi:hypothetical protein